jgi:hypothetical protein
VGKWVEVDRIGPGLVTEFQPVWNKVALRHFKPV